MRVSVAMLATACLSSGSAFAAEDYNQIVEAGTKEGSLLVYANISAPNWQPIIDGFRAKYPGIAVELLDLSSTVVIERHIAEASTGVPTADLIVTSQSTGWLQMAERDLIEKYVSPEADAWPDWSKPFPGLYTFSSDPMIFVWGSNSIPENERPHTFEELVKAAEANSGSWSRRLSTYSPINSNATGYLAHYYFLKHHGAKGEQMLRSLQASIQPVLSTSGGGAGQAEKVITSEYIGNYFNSAITVWPLLNDPVRAQFLSWSFIKDGQPLQIRGVGITKAAKNKNAAKLMLDYILSVEGQTAMGKGGLTPARPDVEPTEGVPYTYKSIIAEVGEENVIIEGYDPGMLTEYDRIQALLKDIYKQDF